MNSDRTKDGFNVSVLKYFKSMVITTYNYSSLVDWKTALVIYLSKSFGFEARMRPNHRNEFTIY